MQRLIFIPLYLGLAFPSIAKAESAWLVLYSPGSVEKIQMKDLTQCKQQGKKWKSIIKIPGVASERFVWACFEGK